MPEDSERSKPRKIGGKMFPKISLEEALNYADTLCSFTADGPQPAEVCLSYVFNAAKSQLGIIRTSALKQFGLMMKRGDAFLSTPLAQQATHGNEAERQRARQQACLAPKVFGVVHARCHQQGHVSMPDLRGMIADAGVHAANVDACLRVFQESLVFAGLARIEDDGLSMVIDVCPPAGPCQRGDEPEDSPAEAPQAWEKEVSPLARIRLGGGKEVEFFQESPTLRWLLVQLLEDSPK